MTGGRLDGAVAASRTTASVTRAPCGLARFSATSILCSVDGSAPFGVRRLYGSPACAGAAGAAGGIGGVVYLPVGESGPVRALRTSPRSASSMFAMIARARRLVTSTMNMLDAPAWLPLCETIAAPVRADAPAVAVVGRLAVRGLLRRPHQLQRLGLQQLAVEERVRRTSSGRSAWRGVRRRASSCWCRAATRCRRSRPTRSPSPPAATDRTTPDRAGSSRARDWESPGTDRPATCGSCPPARTRACACSRRRTSSTPLRSRSRAR